MAGREPIRSRGGPLEIALYLALIIISLTLIGLVILQGRTAGLQNRDTSSIYRTKRGLEKTLHQATIVLAVVFLVLALVTSLPIFGSPSTAPVGLADLFGRF
jgi:preprotein translocase subunit SecG